MTGSNRWLALAAALQFALAAPGAVLAADEPEEGERRGVVEEFREMFATPYTEEMYYRTDRLLLTATGSLKPVHKAPSVATVIYAEEIEKMGATTLEEVLETVPGLHVGVSNNAAMEPIYSIRGIHTALNPQVLLLVNSVPVKIMDTGTRAFAVRVPVSIISRVEIVRGPGSAVYGADAFAGTINVITRDGHEIDGVRSGVRAGSFGTYQGWAQYGKSSGPWNVALGMDVKKTEGDDDRMVSNDQQTFFDNLINIPAGLPPASLAGIEPLHSGEERFDAYLYAGRRHCTFRLWGERIYLYELPAGVTQAVTHSTGKISQVLADMAYHNDDVGRDWGVEVRLSYLYINETGHVQLFPAGTALPVGSDGNLFSADTDGTPSLVLFSDGVWGNLQKEDRQYAAEFVTTYTGLNKHSLRLAAGAKHLAEEVDEYKNFGPGGISSPDLLPPFSVIPASLNSISQDDAFLADHSRELVFASIQDEWTLARKWELTAGVRYDHYSDFGETINPRAALVWEPRYDLVVKLLYGRAFRPPSFVELYGQNNPVNIGNRSLEPETISTGELAFDYQPTANFHAVFNLFTYRIDDLIEQVGAGTRVAENARDQEGKGFEFEAGWDVTDTFRLQGNLAYQRSEDAETSAIVPDAPEKQLYLSAFWEFLPRWYVDGQLFYIGGRHRAAGDNRPEIDDYTKVNLTLRCKDFAGRWEAALSVRNVFDEDIREPSTAVISNDLPMEGRSIYGELRLHF